MSAMGDTQLDQYKPLLKRAVEAFRTDPAYAIAMAKQAGTLRARKEAKLRKLADAAGFQEPSGV